MGGPAMIYTVGDSHAWHAWIKIPGVVARHIGPMTMHSFGQGKPIVVEGIPQDAIVCFCWGEIDCRCHVHNHQPWKECIDELVKNYLEAVRLNVPDPNRVWIYNVVPPPREKDVIPSESFPFVGSDDDRRRYVHYMDTILLKGCIDRGYKFVNVFNEYADQDGFLDLKKSDMHVHIEDEKPLAEWIRRNQ